MTSTQELAAFTASVSYDNLSDHVLDELKKRILDSIGIGIAALDEDPVEAVRATVHQAGTGECTLWGGDGSAAPQQAAMHNGALTRYLDFMDSFLAPGETPHPSDTIGACIAAAEDQDAPGTVLLEAVGVAYEIHAALAWHAPVRDNGFDHVTHTVLAACAGAGKAFNLEEGELQHALGIAGTAHNALRVTRTEGINAWKGIASANACRNAVYSCMLARNGMEGPLNLFEGRKGWNQVVAQQDFDVDLDPGCSAVERVMTKRYVAETYAQSAVEGIIELAEEHDIQAEDVASIHLDTFHGAKLIIGGGEGDRHAVETKAQADHSLPYMLAAALTDRAMTNAQYEPEMIQRGEVQRLLQEVTVKEDPELTERFEGTAEEERYPVGEMPAEITVTLRDGSELHVSKDAFQGHPTQPASWEMIEDKFHRSASRYDEDRRERIVQTVKHLEDYAVRELVALLD